MLTTTAKLPSTWAQLLRAGRGPLTRHYLPVMRAAQRLGLVAPCLIREWGNWWQQVDFHAGRLPVVSLSRRFRYPWWRRVILNRYSDFSKAGSVGELLAHELGHVFEYHWAGRRSPYPLRGMRAVFSGRTRFRDPWNDMMAYLEEHPDATCDESRYVTWYAWSDPGEDFAEVFATFLAANGKVGRWRHRAGVSRKLEAIRRAGQAVLAHDEVLRACNRRRLIYLSAGEISFTCPGTQQKYGVPDIAGRYVCPCGAWVEHDGEWIQHREDGLL